MARVGDILAGSILWIAAIVAIEAMFAILFLNLRLVGSPGPVNIAAAATTALLLGFLVFRFRVQLVHMIGRTGDRLAAFPRTRYLLALALLGLVLRLIWVGLYPPQLASDAQVYFTLAERLSANEAYYTAGTWAYWPPGYPLFLAPFFAIFGSSLEAVVVLNLVIFVASLLAVFALARETGGEGAACLAAALFSVWPNNVGLAATVNKEILLILLITTTTLLHLKSQAAAHPARLYFLGGAGLSLGYATLVQPAFQFFLLAPILFGLLGGERPLRLLSSLVLLVAGMAVVIAPWAYRNHGVFGEFVLVSTNGGDGLYRANNPLAHGGWIPVGEVDLSGLPELEANKEGYKLARRWIAENPATFLALSVEKQMRFLGDDSFGIAGSMRINDRLPAGSPEYIATKGLANAFWLGLWCLALLALVARPRGGPVPWNLLFVILCVLYLFGVHSIAESNGKYHVPVMGLIVVWACVAASFQARRESDAESEIRR